MNRTAAGVDAVVVDDDAMWVTRTRASLRAIGRSSIAAGTTDATAAVERGGAALLVVGPTAARDLEWLRACRSSVSGPVIVVTGEASGEAASEAFAAGATAVIVDGTANEGIGSALELVAPRASSHALSERELELLDLVGRGLSNAAIARSLWVSEQTVKFHLSRIFKKLGVSSRTEAVWVARSGQPPDVGSSRLPR